MERKVTVTYTPEIIAKSVKMQWFNLVGVSGLALLLFLIAAFFYFLITGDRSWVFGFSLAALAIYCGFIVFGYFRLLNISKSKLRNMSSPTADFHFTDDGVSIVADTGKTEIAWKLIDKVLKSPDAWILMTGGGGITLPTKKIDTELASFISVRIARK